MRIVTYATHEFGMFRQLVENPFGAVVDVIGMGTPWTGFVGKTKAILEFCRGLPEDEVVTYLDGFDSLIVKDPAPVEALFRAMPKCRVLASTDPQSMGFLTKRIFHTCGDGIANAGMYMGYAGSLVRMLEVFLLNTSGDDQRDMNIFCLANPGSVTLDTDRVIFRNFGPIRLRTTTRQEFFQSFPGTLSLNRMQRFPKEYWSYFKVEILLFLAVVFATLSCRISSSLVMLLLAWYVSSSDAIP